MSTVQDYQYRVSENAKQQLEAERRRRELELARLKAERAEAQRRQREMELAQRKQEANVLSAQAALKNDLAKAEQALAQSKAQVNQAQNELQTQIQAVQNLQKDSDQEYAKLQSSLQQAQDTLEQTNRTASTGVQDTELLIDASARRLQMGNQIGELDQQIQTLQQEMNFVNLQAELQPAAMALLIGMQANGYELKSTLTQGDLICYFKQLDSEHQIAVRMSPAIRRGEDIETWDLLAETFNMEGDLCLEELDDFDTAMEEIDIGELQRINRHPFPIYPKDESSRNREKHGVLPSPQKQAYSAYRSKHHARTKQKA